MVADDCTHERSDAQPSGCATTSGAWSNRRPATPVTVTRDVELDVPADEAWELIGDASGWSDWMVDDADIVVEPGRHGTVNEDDGARSVRIREVVPGERVTFDWWTPGEDSAGSTVVLELRAGRAPHAAAHRRDVPGGGALATRATSMWDVRATCAWARCTALAAA